MASIECTRCGSEFALDAKHTKIVRRDFVVDPRPPKTERLCLACWRSYVEEFLGSEFDVPSSDEGGSAVRPDAGR